MNEAPIWDADLVCERLSENNRRIKLNVVDDKCARELVEVRNGKTSTQSIAQHKQEIVAKRKRVDTRSEVRIESRVNDLYCVFLFFLLGSFSSLLRRRRRRRRRCRADLHLVQIQ